MAARLAPNLQTYAMRDVLRPLMLLGFRELQRHDSISRNLGLQDLHLAVLLGAKMCDIRLRPELRSGESMQLQRDLDLLDRAGDLEEPEALTDLLTDVWLDAASVLLRAMMTTVTHKWTGLQSLALASLVERNRYSATLLSTLPPLKPFDTDEQRLALVRLWINSWIVPGIWLPTMPSSWWMTEVRGHRGVFKTLSQWFVEPQTRKDFVKSWLPVLVETLCEAQGDTFRMRASCLTLD